MNYKLKSNQDNAGPVISMQCPICGHNGTFHRIGVGIFDERSGLWFGQRKCPNIKCNGHVFVVSDMQGNIKTTAPNDTIPFDKNGIPENVLNSFNEAISCHSNNCFVASAIMIRKTLEEICNERGASGKNLRDRLKDLGGKILVPKELIDGMDELRLLGNDAAHIEAKTYEQIGKVEIEISIQFTIEILKAVYQYDDLLEQLRSLKKQQ